MEDLERYVEISDEQYNYIGDELINLLKEYRENRDVQCIYFAPYFSYSSNIICALEVTIVGNSRLLKFAKKIKSYNQNQNGKKYGLKIVVDINNEYDYKTSLKTSEKNNLLNATILYDKTGEYTRIQEEVIELEKAWDPSYFYYENLVELVPKIDPLIINERTKKI